jgi:hypothetical protein
MKKIKNFLLFFLCISIVSCGPSRSIQLGEDKTLLDLVREYQYPYEKYQSRGELLELTEIKDVQFNISRSESSALMSHIEDLSYITYPNADAKFRDQLLEKVKTDVSVSDYKKETCNDQQCVISYKDKGILVFNQKGDNLEAVAIKGKFTSADIQESIKSGEIFNLKQNIKTSTR